MSKEEQIQNYMKSLEISREEAEQLWEDDQADFIGEDGEKMQEKAKKIKPKADRKKVSKVNKERKIDIEKLEILSTLSETLTIMGYEPQIEKEVAIHFGNYTLKLTRHRPNK